MNTINKLSIPLDIMTAVLVTEIVMCTACDNSCVLVSNLASVLPSESPLMTCPFKIAFIPDHWGRTVYRLDIAFQ